MTANHTAAPVPASKTPSKTPGKPPAKPAVADIYPLTPLQKVRSTNLFSGAIISRT
jgi:hypothetical protein